MSKPEHHDLQEFDYWTVLSIQKQLQAAEVFILGQVVYISEGDKPCRSASSKNPNVSIMFLAHTYLPESSTYTICGKSGVCKARKVLLSNINNFVRTEENGNITLSEVPMGYKPFHDELDFQTLIPSDTTTEKETEKNNEDSELYLVERIVKKRFRNNQYEYLVKWYGYSSKDNTWELPSNVPNNLLAAFERNLAAPSTSCPRREGLRQSKKSTYRDDFIFNM